MKDLRITKTLKEIGFEEVGDESPEKNRFQRQSFTKYLRLTLVFMLNSVLRKKFSFCFSKVC